MVRQSRIDYPGALHHIMVRGMERRSIFGGTEDKGRFLDRLGGVLTETGTRCYAYAIMNNHVHLLVETGETLVSRVMQSVLTGYAVDYNLRHNRAGKLYQNRFKSILCDKEDYLLQLIRYIHLNPMRVGMVETLGELDKSLWAGHGVIMGNREAEWLDAGEVLGNFGRTKAKARREYREFIKEGMREEEAVDLSGGGLIRSVGGEWEVLKASRGKRREAGDERILGGGEFVEEVLKRAEEKESMESRLRREGWDFGKVMKKAAEAVGEGAGELQYRSRGKGRTQGRALVCKWLVDDLRYAQSAVAKELGVTQSAVSKLLQRGRKVEKEMGVGW